jgi:hypothetical protein
MSETDVGDSVSLSCKQASDCPGEVMSILDFFKSNKSQAVAKAGIHAAKPGALSTAPVASEARNFEVKMMDAATYAASDEKEWLRYLSQPLRASRKPGVTIKEEHDQWLAARARGRAIAS